MRDSKVSLASPYAEVVGADAASHVPPHSDVAPSLCSVAPFTGPP